MIDPIHRSFSELNDTIDMCRYGLMRNIEKAQTGDGTKCTQVHWTKYTQVPIVRHAFVCLYYAKPLLHETRKLFSAISK